MARTCLFIGLGLLFLTFGPAGTEEVTEGNREVTITLRVRGPAAADPPKDLSARAVATWYGPGKADPVEVGLSRQKPARMELRPGRWVLRAEADGYWGSEHQLELKEATAVALDLWPAGVLEGGFSLQGGLQPPTELNLFLRPAPGESGKEAPPPSKVVCTVEEAAFKCPVPAGLLDFRIQAPGFIPRYLWGIRVAPGQTIRPGRMDLRQGSAVQGWVVTVDGAPLGEDLWVTLRPRGGIVYDAAERERMESLTFKAQVNSRGFFQMEGVPPGAYLLEAQHKKYAPAVVSVRVVEGQVTEIANPPLMLDHPKVVEVFVDPPSGPSDRPWAVHLQRYERDSSRVTSFAQEVMSADGAWRKAVPPGLYLLRIGPNPGETWWMEEVKVEENPAPIQVTMRVVRVKGSVHLGGEPLAAKVYFGGKFGAVRVEATADEDGRFETMLPKAGEWLVHVASADPAVEREIPKVPVEPKPGTDQAIVDLELPNTLLRGKVIVAATGVPVPKSIVTAVSTGETQESSVQVIANQEGLFEFHGLLAGATLVGASGGREDLYADPVLVDVRPEKESQPIVLRAVPRLKVSGTVVSAAGPVAGARITAVPMGIPAISTRIHTADSQGRFTLFLPSTTREMQVTVSAPGFALRTLRLAIPENREIVLGLEQASGTLIVGMDRPLNYSDPNAPSVVLLHGGAFEWLSYLLSWAATSGVQGQGEGGKWVVPSMEPGAYQACWVFPAERPGLDFGITPSDRCVSGYLASNGELTLDLSGKLREERD